MSQQRLDGVGAPFPQGAKVRWADPPPPGFTAGRAWTVTSCGDDPLDPNRWILHAGTSNEKGRITTRWPKGEPARVAPGQ